MPSSATDARAGRSPAFEAAVEPTRSGIGAAIRASSVHLEAADVEPGMAVRATLLIEEALMNVLMHAAGPGRDPATLRIALKVDVQPRAVTVEIEDDGRPFDPRELPAATPPASLDSAATGGLGVHLMRRYARAIHHQRRDGRNRLVLEIVPG